MTKFICEVCGKQFSKPKKLTKGSFALEILLWLCFLLPGVLYSLWRLTTRHEVCPGCKSNRFVLVDGPLGREILKKLSADKVS